MILILGGDFDVVGHNVVPWCGPHTMPHHIMLPQPLHHASYCDGDMESWNGSLGLGGPWKTFVVVCIKQLLHGNEM